MYNRQHVRTVYEIGCESYFDFTEYLFHTLCYNTTISIVGETQKTNTGNSSTNKDFLSKQSPSYAYSL